MWTKLDMFYLTKIYCGWIEIFFKNTFDGDDDDDNDRGDDGDGDNKCEAERCASLVKKRKEHVYTLEGGTSRTKQKSRTAATKANEDVYS